MRRKETEREQSQRRARRRENRRIFFRAAYCTAVLLAAALLFYLPFTGEQEQPAEEELLVEKPRSFRLAVFLEDGFEDRCGPLFLLSFSGEENRLHLAALPPQTDLFGGSLSLRFEQEGPGGVLSRLGDEGIFLSDYVCLSREDCQKITRNFGDLHYQLSAPLSYYDPKTADSFLAAQGFNAANGTEFCKLAALLCRTDPAEGAGFSSELLMRYLRVLPKEPEETDRLVTLLEQAERTSFRAEEQEGLRKLAGQLSGADFALHLPTGRKKKEEKLPGEPFETRFLPDEECLAGLRLLFSS